MPSTDNLLVARGGSVWSAPKGTAAPSTEATAYATPWANVGYIDDQGVTFSPKKTVENVKTWNSLNPVLNIVTAYELSLKFTFKEWTPFTVPLVFGDGAFVANGVGHNKYDLDSTPDDVEYAWGIDWAQNGVKWRFVIPRASVMSVSDIVLVNNKTADFNVTLSILSTDGVPPGTFYTGGTQFTPGS